MFEREEIALVVVHYRTIHHLRLLKRSERVDFARWVLPGGKLEKNETPRAAAKRELREETGVRLGRASSERLYQRCHPDTRKVVHCMYFTVDGAKLVGQSASAVETIESDCVQ